MNGSVQPNCADVPVRIYSLTHHAAVCAVGVDAVSSEDVTKDAHFELHSVWSRCAVDGEKIYLLTYLSSITF